MFRSFFINGKEKRNIREKKNITENTKAYNDYVENGTFEMRTAFLKIRRIFVRM